MFFSNYGNQRLYPFLKAVITGKAGEVIHLVLQPTVLVLCDVGQAARRGFDQLVLDVDGGLVEQLLGLPVPLAGPEPLLQQILVERVT